MESGGGIFKSQLRNESTTQWRLTFLQDILTGALLLAAKIPLDSAMHGRRKAELSVYGVIALYVAGASDLYGSAHVK